MPSKKTVLRPSGSVWLSRDGENILNETRFALLEHLAATGSITQAGQAAGISYRTAWLAVDQLNHLSDKPLVVRTTGGKSGGGTRLTREGASLLRVYQAVRADHARYLENLRLSLEDFERFMQINRKLALKTSARNQLFGQVESLVGDKLAAQVVLALHGKGKNQSRLVAHITQESIENLGLRIGTEAYCLIKANAVSLKKPGTTRAAAKIPVSKPLSPPPINRFPGQVSGQRLTGSQAEITVKLPTGQELISVMPLRSYAALRLDIGMAVEALCPAEQVILGVTG